MVRKCSLLLAVSLYPLTTMSVPAYGGDRETVDSIEVWHLTAAGWVSPDEFLVIDIKRLRSPAYDTAENDPLNDTVQERGTLTEQLPDDHECPMVFFDKRWRRLPDVLAHNERIRKPVGCNDVVRF